MPIQWTISWPAPGSLSATGGSVTWVVQVGAKGNDGADGQNGLSSISDGTALGLLTHVADPAFLLVGNAAGDRARKLTPTGWGLSNLLASVPAGRVPFSDANGLVTSNAGLAFNSGTGTLSAQNIHPLTGHLRLGTGTSAGVQIGTGSIGTGSDAPVLVAGNNPFGFGLTIQRGDNLSPTDLYARNLFSRDGLYVWNGTQYTFRNDLGRTRIGAAGVPTDDGSSSLQVAGAALLTSTGSANGGLTIQPPTGTDVAGIFRVLHSNGLPAFRVNTSGYTARIGPDGASSLVEISSAGRYMTVPSGGFELRGDSFAAFTITNPTIRWPNASPDLRLRRSSANTADFDTGTDGAFADVRARNLTAASTSGRSVTLGVDDANSNVRLQSNSTSFGISLDGAFTGGGASHSFRFGGNPAFIIGPSGAGFFIGNSASVTVNATGARGITLGVDGSNGTLTSDANCFGIALNGAFTGGGATHRFQFGGATVASVNAAGQVCASAGTPLAPGFAFLSATNAGLTFEAGEYLNSPARSGLSFATAGGSGGGMSNDSEWRFGNASRGWGVFFGNLTGGSTSDANDVSRLVQRSRTTATVLRNAGELRSGWVDWTDASRLGRLTLHAYNVASTQEGLRVEANSGGVRLGFYGATAVARQTVSAAATDPATTMALVNELRADLIALGLLQ